MQYVLESPLAFRRYTCERFEAIATWTPSFLRLRSRGSSQHNARNCYNS
ncbi:hypothetical protein [Laspinema olomoucense]|uniref:Uncharacterized protein n=1 Tax=Laspinema olomoucense D3b TaxID=2953688 RepID=A0ABT2NDW5_9CYAN|nr:MULTISPECIES: hypothetical protein [unclassified Laspinema]MCT7975096.1 hypothetical protein [Laspinema sp. D3d]MCT7979950.1 hypothetical protein [Laspinema sp. D3b]MCT7990381.1 hypothetical protein [Laspinema sp. D3a]